MATLIAFRKYALVDFEMIGRGTDWPRRFQILVGDLAEMQAEYKKAAYNREFSVVELYGDDWKLLSKTDSALSMVKTATLEGMTCVPIGALPAVLGGHLIMPDLLHGWTYLKTKVEPSRRHE